MQSTSSQPGFFKKLLQALTAVGTTAALSQILVMLQTLVLARWIGSELNAYVLAAFNVAGLGFMLVNWGFDHWLLQRAAFDQESSRQNLGQVLLVKLFFGALVSLILLIGLPNIKSEIYIVHILLLALLDVFSDSLSNSCYAYLLATGRFKQSSLIVTIARTLRLAGTLLLIALKVRALPLFLGLRLLINVLILVRLWHISAPKIKFVSFSHTKAFCKQAVPFGIAEIVNFFYDRADLTLLAFLNTSKTNYSYFGVSINILLAGTAILQTLQNVIVPHIIQNEKTENKKTLYTQPLIVLLGAGLLGSLFLYFFAEPAINLTMGKDYIPTGPLLRLASPLVLLKAGTIALSSFLIARQQEKLKLLPLAIVSALKTTLILIFYRKYGLEGMIVIFILCESVLLLQYTIQLYRTRHTKPTFTRQVEEERIS